MFQSDQFKYAMTEVVQKCLQPLEEKMEKRLRRLEKIYNEKADQEEEERSVEPEVQLIDIDIFHREINFSWQFFKYVPQSLVISPLSLFLAVFPFYNKASAESRSKFRKFLLQNTNQRLMEEYFFDLSGFAGNSGITATNKITISSYFAHQHRRNETIIADFHTSPTSKREQEFITWEANEQFYHVCYYSDLEMVKVRMEGDENSFLHVFLSTRKSSLYELMSDLNSPNIFFPAERAKLRRVKITLPVFSIDTKTDLTTVLEKVGIEGESLLHEAHFQLNQSGVNVPHVPSEEVPPEPINPSGKEKTIDFLANRPFLFMLTKSDHVMYIGWYQ